MTEQQTQILAALADALAAANITGDALTAFIGRAGLLIAREASKANIERLRLAQAQAASEGEVAVQRAEAELRAIDAQLAAAVA